MYKTADLAGKIKTIGAGYIVTTDGVSLQYWKEKKLWWPMFGFFDLLEHSEHLK